MVQNEIQTKKIQGISLEKGRLDKEFSFSLGNEHIPSLHEEPVKSLGRWYTESLSDVDRVKEIEDQLLSGLKSIHRCVLPGQLKLWCLKYRLFPRIAWPLAMYEIAMTHVERFERKISSFICKWLGMPPGVSNIVFYGQSNKLLLPLTALTEEFKVGKARVFRTLRDSQHPIIRDTVPDVRTGIKWDAKQEVEAMESRLRHKEIIGAVQKDRAGFGSRPVSFFSKASTKGR